jgi:hypothetical protein
MDAPTVKCQSTSTKNPFPDAKIRKRSPNRNSSIPAKITSDVPRRFRK